MRIRQRWDKRDDQEKEEEEEEDEGEGELGLQTNGARGGGMRGWDGCRSGKIGRAHV